MKENRTHQPAKKHIHLSLKTFGELISSQIHIYIKQLRILILQNEITLS